MKNSIKSLMLLVALGTISQNTLAKVTNSQNTSSALTKHINEEEMMQAYRAEKAATSPIAQIYKQKQQERKESEAATKIQAAFRGYKARKELAEKIQELKSHKLKAFAKGLLNMGLTAATVAIVIAYITYTNQTPEVINPILEIAKEATTCGLTQAPKTLASRAAECYTSCTVNKKCIEQCLEQLYKFVIWKNEHGV